MTSLAKTLDQSVICGLAVVLVAGCGGSPKFPTRMRPTPKASADLEESSAPAGETTALEQVLADFKPPFPDRTQLFQPPRNPTGAAKPEAASPVALRGFVNVNGLKALLSVNGQTSPVQVGEQLAGVDVIAIDPPSITLQRGRIRWTEQLFQ